MDSHFRELVVSTRAKLARRSAEPAPETAAVRIEPVSLYAGGAEVAERWWREAMKVCGVPCETSTRPLVLTAGLIRKRGATQGRPRAKTRRVVKLLAGWLEQQSSGPPAGEAAASPGSQVSSGNRILARKMAASLDADGDGDISVRRRLCPCRPTAQA